MLFFSRRAAAAAGLCALALAGCGSSSHADTSTAAAAAVPAAGGASYSPVSSVATSKQTVSRPKRHVPRSLMLVGDSLGVGISPLLQSGLAGWNVKTDDLVGRPLATGMAIWRQRTTRPGVAAFSLFTNDDPRALSSLRSAVRETLRDQKGRCVIWATIHRAPVGGVSYTAANQLLKRMAARNPKRLKIVDWAGAVAKSPSLIGPDGVHGTAAGYATRARMYENAARSCVS